MAWERWGQENYQEDNAAQDRFDGILVYINMDSWDPGSSTWRRYIAGQYTFEQADNRGINTVYQHMDSRDTYTPPPEDDLSEYAIKRSFEIYF